MKIVSHNFRGPERGGGLIRAEQIQDRDENINTRDSNLAVVITLVLIPRFFRQAAIYAN